MINILFIHQSAELYGSDKTLLLLLSKIDKQRFFPVVVLPYAGPLKAELEKEGIKVVVAPVLKLYRKIFTLPNMMAFFREIKVAVKNLDALHNQYHFDIVYSNTLAVLLGMIYARKRNIRHIWHVHEIIVHPKFIATLFPLLLDRFSNTIVCNSHATKDNLVQRKKSLSAKAVVIHNGTDPNQSNFPEMPLTRSALGFGHDDIVVTLVGRISRLKGHKLLLNAYTQYLGGRNIKILFVGSPVEGQEYYLEEVEQLIKGNGLTKNVKILSFIGNLNPVWAVTDIAVVPSTEAESFGLVALEAMLASRPVIGSNHGGLTELITDNETGVLVQPNDAKALAQAILKLTANPGLRVAFGQNGFRKAVAEFSIVKYVRSFEDLLAGQK